MPLYNRNISVIKRINSFLGCSFHCIALTLDKHKYSSLLRLFSMPVSVFVSFELFLSTIKIESFASAHMLNANNLRIWWKEQLCTIKENRNKDDRHQQRTKTKQVNETINIRNKPCKLSTQQKTGVEIGVIQWTPSRTHCDSMEFTYARRQAPTYANPCEMQYRQIGKQKCMDIYWMFWIRLYSWLDHCPITNFERSEKLHQQSRWSKAAKIQWSRSIRPKLIVL